MDNPSLSTMTVIYKTNLNFDTTKLAECLPINEMLIKVEKKGVLKKGESSRDKIKHRSKKEKKATSNTGFGHNSITTVIKNDAEGRLPLKEITVKIFQNGVFHLTGVLNELYDKSCMDYLLTEINNTCQDSYRKPVEKIEVIDRQVVLMNYTTKLTTIKTIPREALHNAIRNQKIKDVVSYYDPDVYPGVKICIGTGKWKAKVFRTGKIILTGITTQNDCLKLIEQLLALFDLVLPQKQTPVYMSNITAQP